MPRFAGEKTRTPPLIAMLGVLALFLIAGATDRLSAQDMSRYQPHPSGKSSSNPTALHDVANTAPALKNCLKLKSQKGEDQSACLGLTMDVCLQHRSNETTLGSIQCAHGEAEAWMQIQNDARRGIEKKGDTGVRASIEASQKTWEAHRQAQCGVWGEVFRGGSIARQIGADCMRESAGRRALYLIGVLEALQP